MSLARKKRPYEYSQVREQTDRQESLRQITGRQESLRQSKIEAERLREKLQSAILDNPKAAKKAAAVLTLWIAGKARGSTKPKK